MSGWIECPTPGCPGDMRYAAPGRGHIPGCTAPVTASDARPREHVPAPAVTICGSTGLVYCKACGYLLASDRTGRRPKADEPCTPNRLALR